MVQKFKQVWDMLRNDPSEAKFFAWSKMSPQQVTNQFVQKCKANGVSKPTFILSFDCDTKKDVQVLPDVQKKLIGMGITPIYAVPGKLLEYGKDVYQQIQKDGCEFINHGYAEHCHLLDDGITYESSFFYDQLPLDVVKQDIINGDQAIKEVLGVEPKGFRTPHFGTFQSEKHLRFLHQVLSELNYTFSTSTSPLQGLKFGPGFRKFGLPEFPMTGCPSKPLRILDSWSFRFAPGKVENEKDYLLHITDMTNRLENGEPYLVNLYADPSQVYDWDDFFLSMERLAPYNISSYTELLETMNND